MNPLLPELADLSSRSLQSLESVEVVGDLLDDILQHLAVDFLQLRKLFFQLREAGVAIHLVLKTPVPDKGTPHKPGEQPLFNGVRGVDPVSGDVPHCRLYGSIGGHQAIRSPVRGESVLPRGCNSSPRLKPGACLHPLTPFCKFPEPDTSSLLSASRLAAGSLPALLCVAGGAPCPGVDAVDSTKILENECEGSDSNARTPTRQGPQPCAFDLAWQPSPGYEEITPLCMNRDGRCIGCAFAPRLPHLICRHT